MRSRSLTRLAILGLVAAIGAACGGFRRGDVWVEGSTGGASESESDGEGLGFAADVRPLLIDGCASCHAAGASAGDTAFLLGDDVDADRESTLDFVDLEDPEGSRLLTKAAGVGHVGGAIFSLDGPEAALILTWIEAGALP